MNEIIQQIKAHARQAQIQPQFAKDQAWEIEQLAEALQARANERIEALREAVEEETGVDRKLLCAREAVAGMILYGNFSYTEITGNRENIARVCVRAIELYEGGFGK